MSYLIFYQIYFAFNLFDNTFKTIVSVMALDDQKGNGIWLYPPNTSGIGYPNQSNDS